jgi:hypothetical protein
VQAIKKETSGHFEDALLAVVQSTCYPANFFAQVLASPTQKVDDVSTSVSREKEIYLGLWFESF